MNPHELITANRSATSPYHRWSQDETLVASVRGEVVESGQMGRFSLGMDAVLLAIADGVGSGAGDTPPARQALGAALAEVRARAGEERLVDLIDHAFEAANRAVAPTHLPAEDVVELWNYGSTLTMALVNGLHVWIAHIGDSRAYLVRRDRIFRLTHDHTLVELLVRAGQITRAEAATHQFKNVMLATLGSFLEVTPSIVRLELRPGDRLVLCTNGVSDVVSEEALAAEVAKATDANAACASVVDAVLGAGLTDHATILVAEVTGAGDSDGGAAEPAVTVVRDVLAEREQEIAHDPDANLRLRDS